MVSPTVGHNPDERGAHDKIQKPYREKFSAELERVGFKKWEPFWVRLEHEGYRELGAWWASLWPLLTDEGRPPAPGREMEEREKIMAKLTPNDRARAERMEEFDLGTWDIESTVLDLGEWALMGGPRGDRVFVWNWNMNKRPTVLDGALRMDTFRDPWDANSRRVVGGINAVWEMMESRFEFMAAAAADQAAALFLPHARQLCADMNATLLEEEAKLERIRDQLNEEIIRVRERRAEQEKRLNLEIEK